MEAYSRKKIVVIASVATVFFTPLGKNTKTQINKTFNIPVVAIHCSNAQNVGFKNPTYGKLKI